MVISRFAIIVSKHDFSISDFASSLYLVAVMIDFSARLSWSSFSASSVMAKSAACLIAMLSFSSWSLVVVTI